MVNSIGVCADWDLVLVVNKSFNSLCHPLVWIQRFVIGREVTVTFTVFFAAVAPFSALGAGVTVFLGVASLGTGAAVI